MVLKRQNQYPSKILRIYAIIKGKNGAILILHDK
jgi:hypothetical protein